MQEEKEDLEEEGLEEEGLEGIIELRKFFLLEYKKDKVDFKKKSQEYEEFPPTLSRANKIRFYFISKKEYFPCLIEQTKKELENFEKEFEDNLFKRIKNYMPFSNYKTLKNELEEKLKVLRNSLEICTKKYDNLFCDILDGRLG
ncbi:MAG: hypothetical protein JW891_02025 [Candidatus Lokiarchaeota archaeon]|nr:hypothetical protein [Candidatus Lokiarchaeota archaeon]